MKIIFEKRKLIISLISVIILFIGAKPNEIVHFEQLSPLIIDSMKYSNPKIRNHYKTYQFTEKKYISIVDLDSLKSIVLFYEIKENKKSILSSILDLPIDLSMGEPKFFSNYRCNSCLSWMIYKTSTKFIIVKLNNYLSRKGNYWNKKNETIEYSVITTEIPVIFNENYLINKIHVGKSAPFGCYLIEHDFHSDEDGNTSVESIWLCEDMIECKRKIILNN